MNAFKLASNVGFVIFAFGIAVAIYGFSFLMAQNDLEANSERVKGTVIELVPNGPMYISPMVRFTTLDGKEITYKSDLDLNKDLSPYTVGQEVDIIYHKDNPYNAKIDSFIENNFGQLFLGIFGVFLMIFGLIFRKMMLRNAERYA